MIEGLSSKAFAQGAVQWICPEAAALETDGYWEVRCAFEGRTATSCFLEIAADARYAAWVNGHFLGAGPYPDWPRTRSVDRWKLDGALRENETNELVVLLHRIGEATFSHVPGETGVAFAVSDDAEVLAVSGPDCQWRRSPHYQTGALPRITPQLGFGFAYDADGAPLPWNPVLASEGQSLSATGRDFRPRPLPPCELLGRTTATVVAQGFFRRVANPQNEPLAWRMQRDWLSFRETGEVFGGHVPVPHLLEKSALTLRELPAGADGAWLVIDLGRETSGFLELELSATGPALMEIAWGQHLDDLRVRSQVGQRYFACSYRCRAGRQTFFEPLTRLGGRYLQIQISGQTQGLVLHYAGLRESLYPLPAARPCPSDDALDRAIYDLCVRTLHLCMGDHYEDTPWREQGLYANDALNQSLAGYAVFGESQYAQASFDLLGGGLREDGFLELCAPAEVPVTIPAFTFAWVMGVDRNIQFSGDVDFARRQWPRVKSILDKAAARLADGLLPSPQGAGYWHFYDWTDGGLDGTVEGDATQFAVLEGVRFDAALNGFFLLALDAGGRIARMLAELQDDREWSGLAERVRAACRRNFWDDDAKVFRTIRAGAPVRGEEPASELVQALCLLAGCCPSQEEANLRARLLDPARSGWVAASLSQSIHTFEALAADRSFHEGVRARIRQTWGRMVGAGATACWETGQAGWAFDRAGSLGHGWSAFPPYIMRRLAE